MQRYKRFNTGPLLSSYWITIQLEEKGVTPWAALSFSFTETINTVPLKIPDDFIRTLCDI